MINTCCCDTLNVFNLSKAGLLFGVTDRSSAIPDGAARLMVMVILHVQFGTDAVAVTCTVHRND